MSELVPEQPEPVLTMIPNSQSHTALNGTNGKLSDRYLFKTIKVRPETFKQLVQWKAEKETEQGRLLSFEHFFQQVIGEHFSAKDIKKSNVKEVI